MAYAVEHTDTFGGEANCGIGPVCADKFGF
jgi:hypothetical protein